MRNQNTKMRERYPHSFEALITRLMILWYPCLGENQVKKLVKNWVNRQHQSSRK